MINAPAPELGDNVPVKSATSLPSQFVPFHLINTRFGSHGLPFSSAEARLYNTRRFIGHAHAQPAWIPLPDGSLGSRRAIRLPCSVQEPQNIQIPDEVEPSAFNCEKPLNSWPFFRMTLPLLSVKSANARPLHSLASSSADGPSGSR